MRINPISSNNVVNLQQVKNNQRVKLGNVSDVVSLSKNTIGIERQGKNLHVSFTGKFADPIDAGVQFKIAGVTRHQKGWCSCGGNRR